ncbi:MAG: glycosyl hydrolase family 28-related protein, partial [Chthoniobacteraceae bacterium]
MTTTRTLLRILRLAAFGAVAAAAFTAKAKEPVLPNPPLPVIPRHTITVTDSGAKGDGMTDNAKAIQSAIEKCAKAGGGTVVVPKGDFLCGPIQLASRINLRVEKDATLRMLPLEKYPGSTKTPADFISGEGLQDVSISGEGTIDGQGAPWWPFAKEKNASRPRMIKLSK